MKRGTISHHKTAALARELGVPRYAAVGILESLWHATAQYAPRGDVARLGDAGIAHHVGWDGEATVLITALVACGWLDSHPTEGLVVHDWPEHADDAVHMAVARRLELFADGSMPRLTRLGKKEREDIEAAYAKKHTSVHGVHTPCTQKHTAPPSPAQPSQSPASAPPRPAPPGPSLCPVQPTPSARNSHPVLPSAPSVRLAGQELRGEGSGWTGPGDPPSVPQADAVRLRTDPDDPTAKYLDDDTRRQWLAEFLEDHGIGPPTDSELIELGCTVEQAERTWAAVQVDAGAADKPGAFVFRMRRDFGKGGRKDALPRADADGVTRLERIRRNKQAGAR